MATKLKKEHIEKLIKIIKRWNSDRLDLFEISLPNENGEFFGVMRFYFQEEGAKVATKCIRVTSTATTLQVINTLIEKFRPDMRLLLSCPLYSLYEVHINGDERKIEDDEKPLLVQLNWNKDDREGRFLLKREDDKTKPTGLDDSYYRGREVKTFLNHSVIENSDMTPQRCDTVNKNNHNHSFFSSFSSATLFHNHDSEKNRAKLLENNNVSPNNDNSGIYDPVEMARNMEAETVEKNGKERNTTTRKSKKKKEKSTKNGTPIKTVANEKDVKISDKLYEAMPETSFTRSISNPEAVMRRRRQQKLEKKLRLIKAIGKNQNNTNGNIGNTKNDPGKFDNYASTFSKNEGGGIKNGILANGGGMLKIYGESLKPGIPYKTLLLATNDTASYVVREILNKYGMPDHEPSDYCLFKVQIPLIKDGESERIYDITSNCQNFKSQYILEDQESPLALLHQGALTRKNENELFYIGLRPKEYREIIAKQNQNKSQHLLHDASFYSVPNPSFLNKTLNPAILDRSSLNRENGSNTCFNVISSESNRNLHNNMTDNTLVLNDSISILYDKKHSNKDTQRSPVEQNLNLSKEWHHPVLIELNPDNTEITHRSPIIHHLISNVIEIGCEYPTDSGAIYLQLKGDGIFPKHCILTSTSNNVYCTPCKPEALIFINGIFIRESTLLKPDSCIKFGINHSFRFLVPKSSHDSNGGTPRLRNYSLSSQQSLPISHNKSSSNVEELNYDDSIKGRAHEIDHHKQSTLQGSPSPASNVFKFLNHVKQNENLPAFLDISPDVTEDTILKTIFFPADLLKSQEDGDDKNDLSHHQSQEPNNAISFAWNSSFKLSPAYLVYLCCRHYYYTSKRVEYIHPAGHRLEPFMAKMCLVVSSCMESHRDNPIILTFWTANLSEIIYCLTKDKGLMPFLTPQTQNILKTCMISAFKYLTRKLCLDIATLLPYLFQPPNNAGLNNNGQSSNSLIKDANSSSIVKEYDEPFIRSSCSPLLKTLTSLMNMLKQHRLNASITIQIFTRIFQFVEAWTINSIFSHSCALYFGSSNHMGPVLRLNYNQGHNTHCNETDILLNNFPYSRDWGNILSFRIEEIYKWSEIHGLELSAENQLVRIVQILKLLKMPKYHLQDLPQITSTCFNLNSLQIYTIMTNYRYSPGEPLIPNELVERVVNIAHNTTDELLKRETTCPTIDPVNLLINDPYCDTQIMKGDKDKETNNDSIDKEIMDGKVNFMFPEDGFSFDAVKNVPGGLLGLIQRFLTEKGLAQLIILPPTLNRDGSWNVHFNSRSSFNLSDISLISATHYQKEHLNSDSDKQDFKLDLSLSPQLNLANVKTVTITKTDKCLGLSIVAAQTSPLSELGIYVKAVVRGGAAQLAGAPSAGDRILTVNGISLIGVDEEIAAKIMTRAGPVITLSYVRDARGPSGSILNGSIAGDDTAALSPRSGRGSNRASYQYNTLSIANGSKTTQQPIMNDHFVYSSHFNSSYDLKQSSATLPPKSTRPLSHHINVNSPQPYKIKFSNDRVQFGHQSNPNNNNSSDLIAQGKMNAGFMNTLMTNSLSINESSHLKSNITANSSTSKDFQPPIGSYPIFANSPISFNNNNNSPIPYSKPSFTFANNHKVLPLGYSHRHTKSYSPAIDNQHPSVNASKNPPYDLGNYPCINYGNNYYKVAVLPFSIESENASSPSTLEKGLQNHSGISLSNLTCSNINNEAVIRNSGKPIPQDNYIGAKQKILFCQEMMNELHNKGDLTHEENEKLNALIMEYEFQKRVLEEEEMSEDDEANRSPDKLFNQNAYVKQFFIPENGQKIDDFPYNNTYENSADNNIQLPKIENLDLSINVKNNERNDHSSANKNTTPNFKQPSSFEYDNNINSAKISVNQSKTNIDTNLNKPRPPDRSFASFNATNFIHENSSLGNDDNLAGNIHFTQKNSEYQQGFNNLSYTPLIQYNHMKDTLNQNENNSSNVLKAPQFKQTPVVTNHDIFSNYTRTKNLQDISNLYKPDLQLSSHLFNSEGERGPTPNSNNNNYTPGVIGAQEVYLDPRVKLQMMKQKQQQLHHADKMINAPFNDNESRSYTSDHYTKKSHSPTKQYNTSQFNKDTNITIPGNSNTISNVNQSDISDPSNMIENDNNSPERMSFRDKMKKFAQVSASNNHLIPSPYYGCEVDNNQLSDPADLYHINQNGNSLYSKETNVGPPPIHLVEKLRISKTQKKIEDTLLHLS
ncbi:uncharacterized protein LOC135932087 [Gordionus sp. m RMFG-2023]|uniref:uncharacterized protein LOC135932087 n=1 Tax=Gordionus sp. m RMFG-2023 TaxID=3053472 RepID=UPI0031FC466A